MGMMESAVTPAPKPLKPGLKAAAIIRKIATYPRDKDGEFIQPDKNSPELEIVMNHNRMRYANQYDLADTHGFGNSHTYDPEGRYVCGRCNQLDAKPNDCLIIEDLDPEDIDPEASSCRHFEMICAGDTEVRLKCTTKAAAIFGTLREGKKFGCWSCPHYKKGKWQDSLGRPGWCGSGYFTTEPRVCCALNSAPTKGDPPESGENYGTA